MATWRTIAATETDPEAPITSALMKALADNPRAIAEGASGADKILDAALSTSVTTAGIDWVRNRTAGVSVGTVGTYAFLLDAATAGPVTAGTTRPGANLRYSGTANNLGGTPSGTWLAMGTINAVNQATLFLRIS